MGTTLGCGWGWFDCVSVHDKNPKFLYTVYDKGFNCAWIPHKKNPIISVHHLQSLTTKL